jgi:hypothetical protein
VDAPEIVIQTEASVSRPVQQTKERAQLGPLLDLLIEPGQLTATARADELLNHPTNRTAVDKPTRDV